MHWQHLLFEVCWFWLLGGPAAGLKCLSSSNCSRSCRGAVVAMLCAGGL